MESISRLAEQPANLGGCLSGCGLLALSLERPERGLEEGLVDSTLEDRHVHLDALRQHIATLHVHLLGELGGRQVNGHLATPLLRERRNAYISPHGDVSIISPQLAGVFGPRSGWARR